MGNHFFKLTILKQLNTHSENYKLLFLSYTIPKKKRRIGLNMKNFKNKSNRGNYRILSHVFEWAKIY